MNDAARTLMHGDCLNLMGLMEPLSVSTIVTDPPYGWGFLGKAWDHGVPGRRFWEAALRVAKPGCHLLAFGGPRTVHRLTCAIEDAGWEIRDCLVWLYGQGMPKSHNLKGEWDGWGTGLKPSWEPIVLARKPLAGTVAANVVEHGCGALNIDGCRIETTDVGVPISTGARADLTDYRFNGGGMSGGPTSAAGRWPANAILDETTATLLDEQAGERRGCPVTTLRRSTPKFGTVYSPYEGAREESAGYGDTGGASRFFYCPKPSPAERGGENTHPTVKPVELMRWLIRLVTPPGGLVLDPFMGSGTTGIACGYEGVRFTGIEIDADYLAMAERRIRESLRPVSKLDPAPPRAPLPGQLALWGEGEGG